MTTVPPVKVEVLFGDEPQQTVTHQGKTYVVTDVSNNRAARTEVIAGKETTVMPYTVRISHRLGGILFATVHIDDVRVGRRHIRSEEFWRIEGIRSDAGLQELLLVFPIEGADNLTIDARREKVGCIKVKLTEAIFEGMKGFPRFAPHSNNIEQPTRQFLAMPALTKKQANQITRGQYTLMSSNTGRVLKENGQRVGTTLRSSYRSGRHIATVELHYLPSTSLQILGALPMPPPQQEPVQVALPHQKTEVQLEVAAPPPMKTEVQPEVLSTAHQKTETKTTVVSLPHQKTAQTTVGSPSHQETAQTTVVSPSHQKTAQTTAVSSSHQEVAQTKPVSPSHQKTAQTIVVTPSHQETAQTTVVSPSHQKTAQTTVVSPSHQKTAQTKAFSPSHQKTEIKTKAASPLQKDGKDTKYTDFTLVRTNTLGSGASDCFVTLCEPAKKNTKMEIEDEGSDIEFIAEEGSDIEFIAEEGSDIEFIAEEGSDIEFIAEEGSDIEFIAEEGSDIEFIAETRTKMEIEDEGSDIEIIAETKTKMEIEEKGSDIEIIAETKTKMEIKEKGSDIEIIAETRTKMEIEEEREDIEIIKVVAGEVLYMGDGECHMYDVPEKDISIVELD